MKTEIQEKIESKLLEGFASLPEHQPTLDWKRMEEVLSEVAVKLQDNFPYFHPLYAGQMLKPPHPIAQMAYNLAMTVNPNNHALDGGRASSAMEKEVVAGIAKMFGWETHLGHLTSGGTFANLEALWIAGKIHPDKMIVASELAHYTHERISHVLGLDFQKVASNHQGEMDLVALEKLLKTGKVGTVVVTLGTTGIGSTDDLKSILALKSKNDFRIHVDSAYGGYFKLAKYLPKRTLDRYSLIHEADSIVVDPHKHGLQPYGCGCILFKNPALGSYYKHDSPYTYFSSAELHLGEISLECSRAGASAVGLWATMQLLPLEKGGAFAQNLEKCHQAATVLYDKIVESPKFIPLLEPELDIICWCPTGKSISEINEKSNALFNKTAEQNLHLALLKYPIEKLQSQFDGIIKDEKHLVCLRSCLMKEEHLDWIEKIWKIIDEQA